MVTWKFICFVQTASMRHLELDKYNSHILYVAKHKTLNKYRLFMIRSDPWSSGEARNNFGAIDSFQTADFSMPPESVSRLKHVDLLTALGDDGLLISLVCQYEESLWTVRLDSQAAPKQVLPS